MNHITQAKNFLLAKNKILQAKNILLVTHNNPDGDALSSVSAMIEYLELLKKSCSAYCYDQPPQQLSFLPHTEKIIYDKKQLNFKLFDLFIVLDCGSLQRTKLASEILSRQKWQQVIEFDHHPKIDDYADLEIRIPQACSTTEILYDFFTVNNIPINKNMACAILAGILTDTGHFLFPSTNDKNIAIAAEMIKKGASFPYITKNTWRNKSVAAMRIWGQVMGSLKLNKKYNIAFAILSKDLLVASRTNPEEFEGLSSFLSNLYGVNVLLLLQEKDDNNIKGSLRTSRQNVNVANLAKILGGGGHAKAAGFGLKGKIKKTENSWKIL